MQESIRIDGYASVGFNKEGDKAVIFEYTSLSEGTAMYLSEWVDKGDASSLFKLSDFGNEVQDKLFLVTFSIQDTSFFNGEHMDYEIDIVVHQKLVIQSAFQKLWSNNVFWLYELTLEEMSMSGDNVLSDNVEEYLPEEIEDWETFYGIPYPYHQLKKEREDAYARKNIFKFDC